MDKIRISLLCLLLISGLSSAAQQAPAPSATGLASTGSEFLRICQPHFNPDVAAEGTKAAWTEGMCMAYVAGVSGGANLVAIERLHAPLFCLSPEMDNWTLYHITIAYIETHPEKSNSPSRVLIVDALSAAFPCHAAEKGK